MLIFPDLYSSTFQPLEWDILDDTLKSQLDLIKFYTSLLRNWAVALLCSPPPFFIGAAIGSLTTHASTLSLTILQNSSVQTTSTHDSILAFYETTASLLSHPTLQPHIRITTPPSALIYTLHFTPSLSTLSRLCAILALYKRAFETAMSKPAPPSADPSRPVVEPYAKDYVNHFNGFLMDICNCLWRARAFNTSDTNALGCLLPPPLLSILTSYVPSLDTGLSLQSLFSLSYSPVLCNLSISYLRELEDKAEEAAEGGIQIRHAGPVTQKSLVALGKEGGLQLAWPAYRLGVLTYLEGKGDNGVVELMYNTMKHLMTAR
jgi:centromere protein I